MAEAAAAGKRGPSCTLGSLAELRQVAMALAGGWAAAATEKGRAVVTVPMGGQHVLLAIRIEHKRRIQSEDWLAGDRRTRGRLRAVLAASMMRQETGLWNRALPMCP